MPQKMTMGTASLAAMLVAFSALGACSPESKPTPTEQEKHAKDQGIPGGPIGRHWYECDDKRARLIDFKNEGLSIELRYKPDDQPATLSAPTQSLQYIGDGMVATFEGSQLYLTGKDLQVECQMATEDGKGAPTKRQ